MIALNLEASAKQRQPLTKLKGKLWNERKYFPIISDKELRCKTYEGITKVNSKKYQIKK